MAEGEAGRFTEAPERPGAVILARHGKPALSRKVRLSADQYREWWADYEIGGLADDQTPPDRLKHTAAEAGFVIASTRPRSVETARAVAEGRAFAEDPMFVEAPLPPPHWPGWLKLSPMIWGGVARFWWGVFNHHDQQESRREAQARSDEAARLLVELAASGQDVLVVAHGFFNGMVGRSLRKHGFRCTVDGGYKYWAQRRFERTRR